MSCPGPRRRLDWILGAGLLCALALVPSQVAAQQKSGVAYRREAPSHCRRGDALFALGRVEDAEAAYEEEMKSEATVECARDGLAKIGSERPCAAAKALWRNGGKEEAHGAYVESLTQKPMRDCAAAGVEKSAKSGDHEDPSCLQRIEDAVRKAVDVSKDLLLLLAEAALVGALLACGVRFVAVRILLVAPCSRRWAARRFTSPIVVVTRIDDSGLEQKLGAATTALLRQYLELDTGNGALKLTSGEATQAETWIDRVSGAGDYGKLIALVIHLFDRARPRHRICIGGALQAAAPGKGHGLSLTVYRASRAGTSTTLWASDFELPTEAGAEAVQGLAVPAAAWASYVIAEETGVKAEDTDGKDMLGAKDALSWALFKAGVELRITRRPDRARSLYEESLARDPDNYGALANLGVIEARSKEYARALPRLEKALKSLESRVHESERKEVSTDPDWFRIKYSLASERFNCADLTGRSRDVGRAKEEARELFAAIRERLEVRSESNWHESRRRLAALEKLDNFLEEEFEPAVLVLLAGIELSERARGAGARDKSERKSLDELRELVVAGKPVSPFALVARVEERWPAPAPELSFNLACFYVQEWQVEEEPGGGDYRLARAIEYTRRCLDDTAPSERLRLRWEIKTDPFLWPVRGLVSKHARARRKAAHLLQSQER